MSSEATLRLEVLPGDVTVAVPDTSALLTPYVLAEQGDWFEDEIAFLRRLPLDGCAAIDVGANYGVYALTLARAVGPRGRVWAFEPEPVTASYLRRSIELNAFAQLELKEVGLSDRVGEADFFVPDNSEYSSLSAAGADQAGARVRRIALRTLDSLESEWRDWDISFVKLDAEGEEQRILSGARRFLADHNPLVMFELKHADTLNAGLVGAFVAAGFGVYQLIPGLQILAPVDVQAGGDASLDRYRLNLFAARGERAASLTAHGLLAEPRSVPDFDWTPDSTSPDALWDMLAARACSQALVATWAESSVSASAGAEVYLRGLRAYVAAHERGAMSPGRRYSALLSAYADVRASVAAARTSARLHSLVRLAWEVGERAAAVQTLDDLARLALSGGVDASEPFLAVSPRFDAIPPRGSLAKWSLAAALEQREALRAFSSYFSGTSGLAWLRFAKQLGYLDPRMERRLALIEAQ